MKYTQEPVLLAVGSGRIKIRCDLCRRKRFKCNRGVPKCTNCLDFNSECTYEDARKRQSNSVLAKIRTASNPKCKLPLTWDQAIQQTSNSWFVQICVRCYLMPFEFLLPNPTEATEINKLTAHSIRNLQKLMNQTTLININYHSGEIVKTFEDAIEAFFCLYNPLFPLFSKEGFLSKPRSATLVKIVIQIGLERMPSTYLTHAAILANNLTLEEINNLPISFDTLQCQLLVYFGIEAPHIKNNYTLFPRFIDRAFPLLGLHIPSRCLERTLARQLFYNASHQLSLGQAIPANLIIWFEATSDHLKQDYKKKRPKYLSRTSDFIHYIASQTTFHSFATVFSAYKHHAKISKDRRPASSFKALLYSHITHLEKNFMWGWRHLSLTTTHHKELLRKTRFVLALRYHTYYIELMKLGVYITDDLNLPISQEPIKNRITEFTQQGLNAAIHNINLVATINLHSCDSEYMRIQVMMPAIAFLICNYSALVSRHGDIQVVDDAILQVKACLRKSQELSASRYSATCFLALIDLLIK